MLTIPYLIKKIDQFYHSAIKEYKLQKWAAEPTGFSMPDDPEDDLEGPATEREPGSLDLYNKLLDIIRTIRDPDIAAEALLIADMYKKAIEMNDGFNFVRKGISNFINIQLEDLDPDDEDDPLNALEEVFNDVHADLTSRAKAAGSNLKGDSPNAEKAIRAVKDEFNQQSLNEELSGASGGKSVSDLSDFDPEAIAKFDPTGGVGLEEGKTKGKGYFVRTVKELKDWIKSYDNEIDRYKEELVGEKNPVIVGKKRRLISLLEELKSKKAQENILREQSEVAPDPAIQKQLENIRNDLKKLKTERNTLKSGLRQNALSLQTDQLLKEYSQAERSGNKKEQFRLEQELALRKVMQSQDHNKGEEVKARKLLLSWLPGMTMSEVGLATFRNLQKKIEEAAAKKIPVEVVRKEQAKQVADIKRTKRIDPNLRSNIYDWANMTLDGFITHLSQALLAERKTIKDKIVGTKNKHVTEAEKTYFKPYLDNVANASNAGDKSALRAAVAKLREQVASAARLTPQFTQYVISVRSSKFFYEFRDRLKQLKTMNVEEKTKLNQSEINFITDTINMGQKLINFYENLEIPSLGIDPVTKKKMPTAPPATATHYKAPTGKINIILNYLQHLLRKKTTEKIDPETGEVLYE